MNAMTCRALQDVAGEVALDLLAAEERAAALEHVATCPGCRLEVSSLGGAIDELLVLVPEMEPSADLVGRVLAEIEARMLVPEVDPPDGFEQRVLARMTAAAASPPARRRRRSSAVRRVLVTAAAVLLAITAGGIVATTRADRAEVVARTAPMRSAAGGAVVGDVALTGDPAALVLRVDDWVGLVRSYGATVDAPTWLAVETAAGTRDVYRLPGVDDQPWTIAIDSDPSAVVAVSIIDNGGAVWCTADLAA